jgi:phasin family protein
MFNQSTEQFQNSFAPVTALVESNVKIIEKLAQQQAALFTGMLNDGVAHVQSLSTEKDINAVVEAQKAFAESAQEKVTAAAKDAYAVVTEAQEKAGELFKGTFAAAK